MAIGYQSRRRSFRKYVYISQVVAVGIVFACAGCSIGNYGTLLARYTYTDTAVVMDSYNIGLQLRPQGPDGGWTLGYRRASYVLPRTEEQPEPTAVVWRCCYAPWPSGSLVMRGTTTLGMELQVTSDISRMTLGYLDQMITAGPPPGGSQAVRIFYNRNQPHLTHIFIQTD